MDEITSTFKAISDKTRLRILSILSNGELCVCNIVEILGTSQPQVSFHLNILKESGFIKDRKVGKWNHYAINEADLFKRFLIISLLEKIKEDRLIIEDQTRLKSIIQKGV